MSQVQIAQAGQRNDLLLESNDVIRIPRKDGLVLVSGEVLFPNAVAFEPSMQLKDYIRPAQAAIRRWPTTRAWSWPIATEAFEQVPVDRLLASSTVKPGDQILVLPKVDEKKRQFWKDADTNHLPDRREC